MTRTFAVIYVCHFSATTTTINMSMTFTLSGRQSTLCGTYYPPVELDAERKYALGLISFNSYNTIPNVDNKFFYYGDNEKLPIPTGSYEINDLEQFLQKKLGVDEIILKPNNNTLKCELFTKNLMVDFRPDDSLHDLLGFSKKILVNGEQHHSDLPVKIIKVTTIRVDSNITAGAYRNDSLMHTIHEFAPNVAPGFAIKEQPGHIIYMPVNVKNINNITLNILDQDGDEINFRGELIEIRLELKEWE
jgi:hypothetical protein